MTPEQREHIIRTIEVGDHFGGGPATDAMRACLAAADCASNPQAEADRRLGAAVREAIGDVNKSLRYGFAARMDGHIFVSDIVRIACDALREEAGR